MITVIGYLLS